ncbi:hypothetical protein ACFQ1Q_13435 [Winogradskyella litorisediminis]|uniref:Uncharacterized protein n=1 Tax=Winogradskyella litorisediminis TaxID=1156618 RepID=A0ABW3NBC1_9FLAO
MNLKKIQECERTKIEKLSQFRLPNYWKNIGIILAVVSIVVMVVSKYTIEERPLYIVEIGRRLILLGLIIIILSKEKIEDEMITSLRAKSLVLAFIFGVGYALIQPLAELMVHNFVYDPNPENTFSYFEILFYMMSTQILFFEVLKRNR